MSLVHAFVLLATLWIGVFALIWEGKGWVNIAVKLCLCVTALIGAVCCAAVLGVTP